MDFKVTQKSLFDGGKFESYPVKKVISSGTASGSVVETDPHRFGNADPHPHQIKIRIRISVRIRIQVIRWVRNRIRINLQMTSQNVWDVSLLERFFKGLSLYWEGRIWIRISIRVKSRIRSSAHFLQEEETFPLICLTPHMFHFKYPYQRKISSIFS
jgi:hypothetical protein